jgi:membrane protease YdiL (CAAX protease family)
MVISFGSTDSAFDQDLLKRTIRRDVRHCVLFLVLFYLFQYAATYILAMLLGKAGLPHLPIGLNAILGMAAGSCAFIIFRKRRYFTDVLLPAAEPMSPKIFLVLVVATQGIQCIFGYLTLLADKVTPEGAPIGKTMENALNPLVTPDGLIYIIILGPVMEELIFRGAIMGRLRRFGDNLAIVISSLLFGFYHMMVAQIPFTVFIGFLLGYVAIRWSMRMSIVLHIIVNALSELFSYGGRIIGHAGDFVMIVCAVAMLIMLVYWRIQFRARINYGAPYYANVYVYGLSSVFLWAFLIATSCLAVMSLTIGMPPKFG